MELIKGEDQMFSIGRWAIWCGTGVVGLFFLLVTTCTMHSNAYEPDVVKAEGEKVRAAAVLEKERLAIIKERLAAVERLVDKGIHPVIARCSVTSSFNNDGCQKIVPRLTEIEVMAGVKGK